MSRIRIMAAFTIVAALALSGVALAAPVKAHNKTPKKTRNVLTITGGTTQVTLSTTSADTLTANHLTVSALAPATAFGDGFSFPIANGRIHRGTRFGVIRQRGGFVISNGTSTLRLLAPKIVSNRDGVVMEAQARTLKRPGVYIVAMRRIARVVGISLAHGTATGTLDLTPFSARGLNKLAGKMIAKAGSAFATVTVTRTVA